MEIIKTLKRTALFLMLLSFDLQTNACSTENTSSKAENFSQIDYLSYIPAESNLLVYANLENFKNTPFGQSIEEEIMDEEALNMSIRKFLKKVGITSQREIERAIDLANVEGRLDGNPVRVKMTLECDLIDDALSIEDEIRY